MNINHEPVIPWCRCNRCSNWILPCPPGPLYFPKYASRFYNPVSTSDFIELRGLLWRDHVFTDWTVEVSCLGVLGLDVHSRGEGGVGSLWEEGRKDLLPVSSWFCIWLFSPYISSLCFPCLHICFCVLISHFHIEIYGLALVQYEYSYLIITAMPPFPRKAPFRSTLFQGCNLGIWKIQFNSNTLKSKRQSL